jgi:hypothetical protein
MLTIFKSIQKFVTRLFGFKYVINRNTSEIHKLSNIKTNCHVELMTNKMMIKNSEEWLKNGYNGCRWCYNEADNDAK